MKNRAGMMGVLALVWAAIPFSAARAQNRFEVGAQIAVHHLPEFGETPVGFGFRFSYAAYLPFFYADAEINRFPTDSAGNLGETQGFFGLRAGLNVGKWGVFAKVRPGFANFGGGAAPNRLSGATFFALDLGGVLEYRFARHVALRWDLSDVETHFGTSGLTAGPGGPVGVPLRTHDNFQTMIGIVVGF